MEIFCSQFKTNINTSNWCYIKKCRFQKKCDVLWLVAWVTAELVQTRSNTIHCIDYYFSSASRQYLSTTTRLQHYVKQKLEHVRHSKKISTSSLHVTIRKHPEPALCTSTVPELQLGHGFYRFWDRNMIFRLNTKTKQSSAAQSHRHFSFIFMRENI